MSGSAHKILLGHNCFDGFVDLNVVVSYLVDFVEKGFFVSLPLFSDFEVMRVDITRVFDFGSQQNVVDYCNNISLCEMGKKKKQPFPNEGVYFSGKVTTFKIYNKLLEFKNNDYSKLKNTGFDVFSHMQKIQNFCRFECEIRKKKFLYFYNKKENDCVFVKDITYSDLLFIWESEFMKIYKFFDSELTKVYEKNDVRDRIYNLTSSKLAPVLYGFYLSLISDGYNSVKFNTSETTFYRKIRLLKQYGIDFNQATDRLCILDIPKNYINVFDMKEIV